MRRRFSRLSIRRAWRFGWIRSRRCMRSKAAAIACCVLAICCGAQEPQKYRVASPGYAYSFPRDHFNHPEFQTEWWYYTGNVLAGDGHRYGFELTFFRQGVDRSTEKT